MGRIAKRGFAAAAALALTLSLAAHAQTPSSQTPSIRTPSTSPSTASPQLKRVTPGAVLITPTTPEAAALRELPLEWVQAARQAGVPMKADIIRVLGKRCGPDAACMARVWRSMRQDVLRHDELQQQQWPQQQWQQQTRPPPIVILPMKPPTAGGPPPSEHLEIEKPAPPQPLPPRPLPPPTTAPVRPDIPLDRPTAGEATTDRKPASGGQAAGAGAGREVSNVVRETSISRPHRPATRPAPPPASAGAGAPAPVPLPPPAADDAAPAVVAQTAPPAVAPAATPLKTRTIHYNHPTVLPFGQSTEFILLIEGAKGGGADEIAGYEGPKKSAQVDLGRRARATLTGPDDEVAIKARNPEVRTVSDRVSTQWIWDVRPLRPGKTTLTLELFDLTNSDDGEEILKYRDVFPVKAGFLDWLKLQIASMDPIWKALTGLVSAGAAVLAWIAARRGVKRRRAKAAR